MGEPLFLPLVIIGGCGWLWTFSDLLAYPPAQSNPTGLFHAPAGRIGGMRDNRHFGALLLSILLSLSALYVAGYFLLCEELAPFSVGGRYAPVRIYPSPWLAKAYAPLALIESQMTGTDVEVGWDVTTF